MKWSWTLGTIGGTKVRIHVTFLFLLVFLGAKFWSESGPRAAAVGIGFFLALFLCVILHEFGHALAARRFGIHTPDITLYPIGGIARLERMPKNPIQELIVAAAGPAVNVFIAALLMILGGLPPVESMTDFSTMTLRSFFGWLMLVNITLVLFNLIPAFPMDGGRMLRAILAMMVDRPRATRWAAAIGQTLAVLGGIAAIRYEAWILLMIAIFIFFAAGQEANMSEAQSTYEGARVRDAMETRFRVLEANDTLKRAAEMLLEGAQHDFPVVDGNGECCGLLLRTDLMRSLANGELESRIGDAAQENFPILSAEQPLAAALESLGASRLPMAPVIDPGGRIEGLLTRENVAEFVTMRQAFNQSRSI